MSKTCAEPWHVLRYAVLALVVLVAPAVVHAQQPGPLSTPNLDFRIAGTVRTMVQLADGSIVAGGSFSSVFDSSSGLTLERRNLAKFGPSGTLDLTWNPGPNGPVDALALGADGSIFVAGQFFVIGGSSRAFLAKLSPVGAGAVDPAWDPGPSNPVSGIALDGNGGLYVGGFFTSVCGLTRNRVARVSVSGMGACDPVWNPDANGQVTAFNVDGSGAVYVGGQFTSIGGQLRSGLARVSTVGAGTADPSWNPAPAFSGNPGRVRALAGIPGGPLYVAGSFNAIGGQARYALAKLSRSGTGLADSSWSPALGTSVDAIALDAVGDVYVGGFFSDIAGQARSHIAKLSGAGSGNVILEWDALEVGVDFDNVASIVVGQAGAIYAGGDFSSVANQIALGLVKLSAATGSFLYGYNVQQPGVVYALAPAADGSVYVGGSFATVSAGAGVVSRRNLLKLDPNGSLDPSWNPSPDSRVQALATGPMNSVYVGGAFRTIGGQARNYVARVSGAGSGTVDPNWNPSADFNVLSLAVDPAGAVFAGGVFSTIGGQSRRSLAKLFGTGTGQADPAWSPQLVGCVFNCVESLVLAGNNLYVAGDFTSIGGQARVNIARLSVTSALADPVWNPSANAHVRALTLDAAASVAFVGGEFTSIGGQPRNYLARIATSGSGVPDAGWDPSPNGQVNTVAVDATGGLYVGGVFNAIQGEQRSYLARFRGTGALDPVWNPAPSAAPLIVTASTANRVYVGGFFLTIGGVPRTALAALPVVVDVVFGNGFE